MSLKLSADTSTEWYNELSYIRDIRENQCKQTSGLYLGFHLWAPLAGSYVPGYGVVCGGGGGGACAAAAFAVPLLG